MSEERPFFKGGDTSWGIFYPTHYFIAVFDSPETAPGAEQSNQADPQTFASIFRPLRAHAV
jgi:hypothetical protein